MNIINARPQIADALRTVCSNVKMTKPDGDVELPLICYAEMVNTPVNIAYVRLGWRIAVYSNTFEELVDLVDQVDGVMTGIGFTRTAKTDDTKARIGTDLYLCRLDYSALVNSATWTVIKGST